MMWFIYTKVNIVYKLHALLFRIVKTTEICDIQENCIKCIHKYLSQFSDTVSAWKVCHILTT